VEIATADSGGLICGFRLAPLEPCDPDLLKLPPVDRSRPCWLHFSVADLRVRRWLEERSGLTAGTVEALLEPEPRAHLELGEDGLLAVLYDLHHDFDRDPEGFGTIRIHVDGHRMISLRRQRLQTVDRLRRDLTKGAAEAETPATLFHRFLDQLAATVGSVVAKMSDLVDTAEDEILAGRYQQQGSTLGRIRRGIARLRRHLNANRSALAVLRGRLPPSIEPARADLHDALGRLETVAQDLELVQERTRLLQEEIAGRLSEATNRNLEVLSLVTTALLPITLITGVFGMNVGGLPGVGDPHGFRWVMTLILIAITVVLVVLMRRWQR
jgi:zinc transporter